MLLWLAKNWLPLTLAAFMLVAGITIREQRNTITGLKSWRSSVIVATSAAFAPADDKGRIGAYRAQDVVPAINAAGNALRAMKFATKEANAGISATAADGLARRATSRDAAAVYDAAYAAVTAGAIGLPPTPVAAGTALPSDEDFAAADNYVRDQWASIR